MISSSSSHVVHSIKDSVFKLSAGAPAHTWALAHRVHQLPPECTSSRLLHMLSLFLFCLVHLFMMFIVSLMYIAFEQIYPLDTTSTLRIFPDSESCRYTLATIHRTLSSPIADGRQLRLKCEICVARDCFVGACFEDERVTPVYLITLLGSVSRYERRVEVEGRFRKNPKPPQQQVAQQSGQHRFRPRGHQFKKKSGSSSSVSGSSSNDSSYKVEFCGQCGGKHPMTQCVGVQASVSSSAYIIDTMTSRLLPQASSTDMMTSALLIPASSNRYADVITTDTSSCAPADFFISFKQQC
ncbi:hypothetical protein F511_38653 [Dorcoceras hygrometricum]|uniref:Uncharacterized protein n=1 Tax=Dorcoceras hygrometricum TaxID=472368 RepID=A0A2Z7B0A0_9LAMI|nr:hypothetical protein F511_38653 [Dorcoceras hygrometricum]